MRKSSLSNKALVTPTIAENRLALAVDVDDLTANTSSVSTTKRTVRFNAMVTVCDVPSVKDMDKAARSQIWYSQKEYHAFKDDASKTLVLLGVKPEAFTSSKNNDLTARGLESLTGRARLARQRARANAVSIVLLRQTELYCCPGLLAATYGIACRECRVEALQRGASDQKAVEREYRNGLKRKVLSALARFL